VSSEYNDARKVQIPVEGLEPGRTYELRAKVKHPLLTVFGTEVRLAPVKTE
jgi:hypothetical protein